jgi:hypothetical protein
VSHLIKFGDPDQHRIIVELRYIAHERVESLHDFGRALGTLRER